MTLDTKTETQVAPSTEAPSLGELSFADYEKVRRGGEVPKVEKKSAPAPKAEQKSTSESETEDTEAKEESLDSTDASDEDSDAGDGEDASKDKADDKQAKKKGGVQKRIDKLISQKSEAQREAEYWKAVALKEKQAEKDKASTDSPKAKASQEGKPDPDKFETHAEYVEAIADWKAEQKLKERDERDAKARAESDQAKVFSAHQARVKSFAEKTEDFQEVLEGVDDLPVSQAIQELLISSENGPELMYELAKNRKEFERINVLSPLAAAREIGRLESKLTPAASENGKAEPTKLTKAPKPLEPVGSNSKSSVRKSIHDADLPFAEYERMRREQMRRRG